eukprot:1145471-Pelagomonas_calceolata.AAC.5
MAFKGEQQAQLRLKRRMQESYWLLGKGEARRKGMIVNVNMIMNLGGLIGKAAAEAHVERIEDVWNFLGRQGVRSSYKLLCTHPTE